MAGMIELACYHCYVFCVRYMLTIRLYHKTALSVAVAHTFNSYKLFQVLLLINKLTAGIIAVIMSRDPLSMTVTNPKQLYLVILVTE